MQRGKHHLYSKASSHCCSSDVRQIQTVAHACCCVRTSLALRCRTRSFAFLAHTHLFYIHLCIYCTSNQHSFAPLGPERKVSPKTRKSACEDVCVLCAPVRAPAEDTMERPAWKVCEIFSRFQDRPAGGKIELRLVSDRQSQKFGEPFSSSPQTHALNS